MNITNKSSNADVKAWLNERGVSEAVPEFEGKITSLLPQYTLLSKRYRALTIYPLIWLISNHSFVNSSQPLDKAKLGTIVTKYICLFVVACVEVN